MSHFKIIGALLVVFALVLGFQHWQMTKLQAKADILMANNSTLDSAVKVQDSTINSLQQGMKESIENTLLLATKIQAADKDRQKIVAQLNSYRGRLNDAALKKPTLVERRATNAFASVLQQYAATTGYTD